MFLFLIKNCSLFLALSLSLPVSFFCPPSCAFCAAQKSALSFSHALCDWSRQFSFVVFHQLKFCFSCFHFLLLLLFIFLLLLLLLLVFSQPALAFGLPRASSCQKLLCIFLAAPRLDAYTLYITHTHRQCPLYAHTPLVLLHTRFLSPPHPHTALYAQPVEGTTASATRRRHCQFLRHCQRHFASAYACVYSISYACCYAHA